MPALVLVFSPSEWLNRACFHYSGALLWKVTEGMCELKDSEAYKEMALLCIRCAELTDNKDASKLWNSRLRMPFLPRQESPDDRPSHS